MTDDNDEKSGIPNRRDSFLRKFGMANAQQRARQQTKPTQAVNRWKRIRYGHVIPM